jgi:pilus assembly protein CpaF
MGRLEKVAHTLTFDDHPHLLRILHRVVTRFGAALDSEKPYVHLRTPDGSRVTATIPPLSPAGPVLTIKKHGGFLKLEDLIRFGTIHREAMRFLSACVDAGLNILITGEASSGTTTLLGVLGTLIPSHEFIVVVDDELELSLEQEQLMYLQARLSDPSLTYDITKAQAFQQAIHMNPERLVIGDLDGETIGILLRTAIPWLVTMHSRSVRDALSKLETATRSVRGDDPLIPLRIVEAVDLVVHLERLRSGSRRVGRISEVRYEDGGLVVHDIYALEILNRKTEARLQIVDRPVGKQFDVPEINALFEDKDS